MKIVLRNESGKEIELAMYAIVKIKDAYLGKGYEYSTELEEGLLFTSKGDIEGVVIEIKKVGDEA